jgi:hypothetical protein
MLDVDALTASSEWEDGLGYRPNITDALLEISRSIDRLANAVNATREEDTAPPKAQAIIIDAPTYDHVESIVRERMADFAATNGEDEVPVIFNGRTLGKTRPTGDFFAEAKALLGEQAVKIARA